MRQQLGDSPDAFAERLARAQLFEPGADPVSRLFGTSAASAAIAMAIGLAAPAHASGDSIDGSVGCIKSDSSPAIPPVGVWVDYDNQKGGWARLTPVSREVANMSYRAPHAVSKFHLHIGCGGSPQHWGTSVNWDGNPGTYGEIVARY